MFWIWKERVAELERKIGTVQQEIQAMQGRGQLFFRHGTKFSKQIEGFFEPQFAASEAALENELAYCATVDVRGWEADYWQSWEASEASLNDYIRIGANAESRGDREFVVPHFAPFIGDNKTLIIVSDDRTADEAIALLQSLAIRIALTLPHQSRFTLIDPVGAGAAFPMQRFYPLCGKLAMTFVEISIKLVPKSEELTPPILMLVQIHLNSCQKIFVLTSV